MSDPKNPQVGDLAIDASSLAPFIIDLAPGERQGMRVAQPGLTDALNEIAANQPGVGTDIGIGDKLLANLNDIATKIQEIDVYLPTARKLVELLEETRAKLDDDRYQIISSVASLVDRIKVSGAVDLYAAYEKTRAYRSAIGKKAAETRRKNTEAQSTTEASVAA